MDQAVSVESGTEITSTSWADAFIAPFRYLTKPADAARAMAGASPGAFRLFYCIGVAVFATTVLFLAMWDATIERSYAPPDYTAQVFERSFGEVWTDWHASGDLGISEAILAWSAGLVVFATALAAWMLLPRVYGGGSAAAAYFRSFRAVASGFGLLWFLELGWGSGLVLAVNYHDRVQGPWDMAPFFLVILLFTGLVAVVWWIGAAARGVALPPERDQDSPICEGCGYDLTHQPMEGLCPECGMAVAESLTEERRRPGADWQNLNTFGSWLESTARLLFEPSRFYGALKMRTPSQASHQFALFHYVTIGILAFPWINVLVISTGGPGDMAMILSTVGMLIIPLVAWTLHRLIGALVASWLIVKGSLADGRSSETVISYEAAFLWAFCALDAALITSYAIYGDWIRAVLQDVGISVFSGFPPEPLAVLFGNLLLCGLWLRRYQLAVKATRWSNF